MKSNLFLWFWTRLAGALATAALALAALALAAGGTAFGITVTPATSDNGLSALSVTWTDAGGQSRTAIMVNQNAQGPGYLRQYTYRVNGVTRTCTGTEKSGEFSGDGFVQNHAAAPEGQDVGGDFASTQLTTAQLAASGTTTVLQGGSHVIIEYDMPDYEIDGPYYNPGNAYKVPTTIQWFFADGRNDPIFSISQDASKAGGNLGADSRSPYGDMVFDGNNPNAFVGGVAYGDTFKYVTLASNPEIVTDASGWDETAPNTIPFAMKWTQSDGANAVDAEIGHVATLPIDLSDQGMDSQYFNGAAMAPGSYYEDNRGLSQPKGPMIDDTAWAYQVFAENPIWPGIDAGIQGDYRLTWGANWGRVGGFDGFNYGQSGQPDSDITTYSRHFDDPVGNPTAPNYKGVGSLADGTLMAYSVFVVFGTHKNTQYPAGSVGQETGGTVGQVVGQMENVTSATLTASVGTVPTSGPYGVGQAGTARSFNYSPAGYDPFYSAWVIAAAGNAVNATLTPAAGKSLDHPVFVVNNYTLGQAPASISVGAGLTTAGTDYFASVDTTGKRLLITVNRSISSALNLVVTPAAAAAAPVVGSIPLNGTVGATIVITGQNFTGATSVSFNGVNAASFTVNSATQITVTVPAGATAGPITVVTAAGPGVSTTNFTPLPAGATLSGTWVSNNVPSLSWTAVASSSDGTRLVAVNDPVASTSFPDGANTIYTSMNSGATWIAGGVPSTNVYWTSVASSADGAKLAAADLSSGSVYTSTDGGGDWAQSGAPARQWFSIASSADGTKLAAAADFYVVYTSPDAGLDWKSNNLPVAVWIAVASSTDGSHLIAAAIPSEIEPGSGVYTSVDGGTTWVSNKISTAGWSGASVASSADGSKLAVAVRSLDTSDQAGLIYLSPDGGKTWAPSTAPAAYWNCVATSADGSIIIAGSYGSPGAGIYVSTDSGTTWASNSVPSEYWSGVACSADGAHIVAVSQSGSIYTFQPNPGPSPQWTPSHSPAYTWDTIAASLTGNRLYAAALSGQILSSTNAGVSWNPASVPGNIWYSLASSSDGIRVAAAAKGSVFTSPDGGSTWVQSGASTNLTWFDIVSSADGTKLVAIGLIPVNPGQGLIKRAGMGTSSPQIGNLVYSSSNSGATWTLNSLPVESWAAVASSADGTRLVAVADPGQIYISTNSGTTWLPTSAPSGNWTCVASSADGTHLAAGGGNGLPGRIYSSTDGGATWRPTSAPPLEWQTLSCSQDGTHLIAISAMSGSNPGAVYTSTDGGADWTPGNLPNQMWASAFFTGLGNQIALVGGGQIYLASSSPDVTTNVTYINTFPTGGNTQPFTGGSVASWVYWYGLGYNNVLMTNDPGMDAGKNTNSGSLKVYLPFGSTGDQGVFFGTFDNASPYDETVTLNGAYVTNLSFDIHFAPGTPLNAAGNLGAITMSIFPVAENGGDFDLFPSVTIPAGATNGWFHATESVATFLAQEPLSGLTNCDAIGFDYNSYSGYPTQPVTFWIDNVAVNAPPPPPPAAPLVTWPAPASISYGTALGPTQLDAAAGVAGTFVYSPAAGAVLGAGAGQSLSVTFTPTDTVDYQPVTTKVTLTVTPAPLTVTANNAGREAGQANPAFTATISGFVHGDNAAVVGGQASLTTVATPASPAGSFPIVAGAGTLSAANYIFTNFVNGTLTVTPAVAPPPLLTWGPVSLPSFSWQAVAASTNGVALVAAAYSGQIYVSTNTGATWRPAPAPSATWVSVASSADGSHLAAVSAPQNFDATMNSNGFNLTGVICVSANGGAAWTVTTAPTNMAWVSIATSADGTKLAAVGLTDSLALMAFNSSDGGATWISNTLPFLGHQGASPSTWASIASSADGSRLVVAGYPGWIYTSANAGASWNTNSAPDATWTSVASSADGMEMAAVNGASGIYTSPDGGVTWNQNGAPDLKWTGVASSPNGANLIAVANSVFAPKIPPGVYVSPDGGADWFSNSVPALNLIAVASTAGGSELLAVDGGGVVYMSPPPPTNAPPAINWTSNSVPMVQWAAVASDAGGTNLVAVGMSVGGLFPVVYHSTNEGVSWTPGNPFPTVPSNESTSYFLNSVAASSDGSKLVAGGLGGWIYLSTDSGATWRASGAPTNFYATGVPVAVASSADGSHLAAAGGGSFGAVFYALSAEPVYTSADSGASWTANAATSAAWTSVAMSTNGSTIAVVGSDPVGGLGIYSITTNGGATWSSNAVPNGEVWLSIAASGDGTRLAAGSVDGPIYISTNSGLTWLATPAPQHEWNSIASSADGTRLAAGSENGEIWISTNGGAGWVLTGAPAVDWLSVACSADGSKMAAASAYDLIDTLELTPEVLPPPSPVSLGISLPGSGTLTITWPSSAVGAVLQQSTNLNGNNWTAVSQTAVNTGTTMSVTITTGPGPVFYRLVQ